MSDNKHTEKCWATALIVIMISITLIVWVSTTTYQEKRMTNFKNATEAGLVQEQKAGSHGYIWVKGE